ncbi:hypothetical protein AWM68_10515 [Fictibacillus phosphorivorans]|uniref:Uncharacterized protein n=1 Tax=Fictibacillus phosphorivorans TaxID=1221500 RepID=A0A165N4I0_9BACL|nr:hypothetical protein [Fictibacillus phosphorivorans]KZE64568.1 hypothetical protein AWM68_10515 [Fictibacillus phosphorivorans]
MSQEKIAKVLMLCVLLYVAIPVLSLDGPLLQRIFTIAWSGFACMLLIGLLFKKDTLKKRSVKKQSISANQKMRKRMHMES